MAPNIAILRAIPDKLMGVIAMFGAIGVLFVLPWLNTSKVKSMRYRPTMRVYFLIFVAVCLVLGFCGAKLPDDPVIPGVHTFTLVDSDLNSFVWLSRIATLYYFAYFIVITPLLGLRETPLPVPDSISKPVLSGEAAKKD
jgi:ubiquinol-cytochrome c reductase cytochrome b subunit